MGHCASARRWRNCHIIRAAARWQDADTYKVTGARTAQQSGELRARRRPRAYASSGISRPGQGAWKQSRDLERRAEKERRERVGATDGGVRCSATAREPHGDDDDENAEEGVRTREVGRTLSEGECLVRAGLRTNSARALDEIMHRAHGDHGDHGHQLDRQGVAHWGSPEHRGPEHAVPPQPPLVVKIDDASDQENPDGPPARGAKAESEFLEQTLSECRWLHGAEDWRPDQAEKEHSANPKHGGEHVDRHIGVVER